MPAGEEFRKWIEYGSVPLVVGGKLLREPDRSKNFRTWRREALRAGKLRIVDHQEVRESTDFLKGNSSCRSDDEHVVALAQVSGARLLFSNDKDLQSDFKNRELLDAPRGKIYSTRLSTKFGNSHKRLLRRTDLCNRGP